MTDQNLTEPGSPSAAPDYRSASTMFYVPNGSKFATHLGGKTVISGDEIVRRKLNPKALVELGHIRLAAPAVIAAAGLMDEANDVPSPATEDEKPPKPPEPPLAEAPTDDLTGATNSATPKATLKKK